MIRILGKKRVAKRIFWGLAVVIIPSFIIWGVGTEMRSGQETLAAKVNRQSISREDYYRHLDALMVQYRQSSGDIPADDGPEMERIKKRVIEDLIQEALLFQEVRRRHIRVTDKEVLATVRRDPAFCDEKGVFDERRYRDAVSRIPDEEWVKIEKNLRRALTLRKLQNLVISEAQVTVTEQELADYRKQYAPKGEIKEDVLRQLIFSQKAGAAFEDWYQKVRAKARVSVFI